MREPTVLTVILNYRTPQMTLQSAEAALKAMQNISGKILIVDNDSQDGSFEALQDGVKNRGWAEADIQVLQSGKNGGFGAGNNFGILHGFANGLDGVLPDYFYILNSDAFPQADALQTLLDHLETTPKCGFAGSYIYGENDEAHMTAFRFPSVAGALEGAARFGPISRLLKNAIVPLPVPEHSCTVDWLAGASMMMRRETLEEIGLFDESFFLYFEETDLCLRANRAGWSVDYVRESKVMHIGSVSTGMKTWQRIPQFWLDSHLHYYLRNHGRLTALGATCMQILGGTLARARALLQGKSIDEPKYFLIDMALHGVRAAFLGRSVKQRNITFPKGLRPLGGDRG